jgi:hypothetical protein
MLHQLPLRYVTRTCIQRNKKAHRGGQERTSRRASAKVFGMAGNPLPTSLARGIPITEVSRWLGYRSIEVTHQIYGHLVPTSWDRARAVLDDAHRAGRRQPPPENPC